MSSSPHNNFLTGATSDADIAVQEILDTYYKKDGSIAMTGLMNLGGNSIFSSSNIELNNQVSGSTPYILQFLLGRKSSFANDVFKFYIAAR